MRGGKRTEPPKEDIQIDWAILRTFLPYLKGYTARIVFALLLLVSAKVATVAVPLVLKRLVDTLDKGDPAQVAGVALSLPVALVLGYGALRFSTTLFQEHELAVELSAL